MSATADWTLTISPDEDTVRPGLRGYRATCSCGYRSPLQTAPEAFRNVAMAAAQHLDHAHKPRLSAPEEINACAEASFLQPSELTEAFVVGHCGHRVARSEWTAGFRNCERC